MRRELVAAVAAAVALLLLGRRALWSIEVEGRSMEPTLRDGQHCVAESLSYCIRAPRRGEIAVIAWDAPPYAVKRIVGVPGERVAVRGEDPPRLLDAVEYFVLGDNRAASVDSRVIGPIKRDAIIGRVWVGPPRDPH